MIDKKLIKDSRMTKRVSNEVEVHWQVHHPSILELYTYFEDKTNVYLVSELCENGELFQYLQNTPHCRLNEDQVRFVLKDIILGLVYLHSHSIVHRDLKLSNLLLTKDYHVKIADFGLAVKLRHEHEQKTMCGTPNYISPEIINRQPVGLSSDIWSLGCMMFTMLVGHPPFQSELVKDTLDKVSKADYIIPSFVSREASDLIHQLLQKNPLKRPAVSKLLRHAFFASHLPYTRLGAGASNSNSHPESLVKVPSRLDQLSSANSIPRISTLRLKPFEQTTKHGIVKINTDRSVSLIFHGDSTQVTISSDGHDIIVYDKRSMQMIDKFNYKSLPIDLLKKYRYASRFIDLVRAKTSKIIFYSPQAKCMLMENTPTPDFEMVFYAGPKIHHSVSKKRLEIRIPLANSTTGQISYDTHVIDVSKPDPVIDSDIQPFFKHAQECIKQCLEIESSANKNPSTHYPVIIKSSSLKLNERGNPHSPTQSIHPSTISTYSTVGQAMTTLVQPSVRGSGQSRGGNTFSSSISMISRPPLIPQPNNTSVKSDCVEHNSEVKKRYIKEIGWCIKHTPSYGNQYVEHDGVFIMCFVDGISVAVYIKEHHLVYEDVDGTSLRLKIDRSLPAHIKNRLAHLPKFMKLF